METSEGPRATEPETIAGDRPPRYGIQNGFAYRRARACPSPYNDREGQALALRARKKKCAGDKPRAPVIERSRGTGPRATVGELRPFCRSRSPDLDPIAIGRSQTTEGSARACPSPCNDREGQALALRARKKKARGTGPRATVIERSRGTGPRATFISFSSPRRMSSASDLPQRRDRATYASPMSPAYHQTQLLRSDSNTQHPASPMYQ